MPAGTGGDYLDWAIPMIKEFEGVELRAYPDPLNGGPWTIGMGQTFYSDGRPVQSGDTMTLKEAEKEFEATFRKYFEPKLILIPHWRDMGNNQKAAIASFAWNLGANFYGSQGFDTITRVLRDRNWNDVPNALMLYRNPGTSVEAGLMRRRTAEGELWRGDGPFMRD